MSGLTYSWSVGPANSRFVRALLSLTTGLLLGYLPVAFIDIIGTSEVSRRALYLGGLFLVLLVIVLARGIFAVRSSPTHWIFTEFAQTVHPVEVGIATLVAIIGLTVLPVRFHLLRIVWFSLLLACLSLALVLSSRGTIDLDARTFTYETIHEYEIPFESVTGLKAFSVGRRTYLWLSFHREDGSGVDRVVMIPSDILTQTRIHYELAQSKENETARSSKQSREVLIAGLLVFGSLGGGLGMVLYAGGFGVILAIVMPVSLFGALFIMFLIGYFTNLFAQIPSK